MSFEVYLIKGASAKDIKLKITNLIHCKLIEKQSNTRSKFPDEIKNPTIIHLIKSNLNIRKNENHCWAPAMLAHFFYQNDAIS